MERLHLRERPAPSATATAAPPGRGQARQATAPSQQQAPAAPRLLTVDSDGVGVQLVVWVERILALLDVAHRHRGDQGGVQPTAQQDGQGRVAHQALGHRVDEGLLQAGRQAGGRVVAVAGAFDSVKTSASGPTGALASLPAKFAGSHPPRQANSTGAIPAACPP